MPGGVGGVAPRGVPYPDHRRISLTPARPGDGLLSDHIAGVRPVRRERVFVPLSGRSLMRLRFGARRRKADFQFLSACDPNRTIQQSTVDAAASSEPVLFLARIA